MTAGPRFWIPIRAVTVSPAAPHTVVPIAARSGRFVPVTSTTTWLKLSTAETSDWGTASSAGAAGASTSCSSGPVPGWPPRLRMAAV
jgi:hypothetical protein